MSSSIHLSLRSCSSFRALRLGVSTTNGSFWYEALIFSCSRRSADISSRRRSSANRPAACRFRIFLATAERSRASRSSLERFISIKYDGVFPYSSCLCTHSGVSSPRRTRCFDPPPSIAARAFSTTQSRVARLVRPASSSSIDGNGAFRVCRSKSPRCSITRSYLCDNAAPNDAVTPSRPRKYSRLLLGAPSSSSSSSRVLLSLSRGGSPNVRLVPRRLSITASRRSRSSRVLVVVRAVDIINSFDAR